MTTTALSAPAQPHAEIDRLADLTRRAEALRAEAHALIEERNELALGLLDEGMSLPRLAAAAGVSKQALGFATGRYKRWTHRKA